MLTLPLIGIIIGILILRPLKGGGLLILGVHFFLAEGEQWLALDAFSPRLH